MWAITGVSQCEDSFEFMFFDKLLRKNHNFVKLTQPNLTQRAHATQ